METKHLNEFNVKAWIKDCQIHNHIQQVAYSTYHDALTQICFGCNKVRTSLKEKDTEARSSEPEEEKE